MLACKPPRPAVQQTPKPAEEPRNRRRTSMQCAYICVPHSNYRPPVCKPKRTARAWTSSRPPVTDGPPRILGTWHRALHLQRPSEADPEHHDRNKTNRPSWAVAFMERERDNCPFSHRPLPGVGPLTHGVVINMLISYEMARWIMTCAVGTCRNLSHVACLLIMFSPQACHNSAQGLRSINKCNKPAILFSGCLFFLSLSVRPPCRGPRCARWRGGLMLLLALA